MSAYVFWHRPFNDIDQEGYESALKAFHDALTLRTGEGFEGSATYRISNTPWLDDLPGYEDWNFVESSAVLDPLNKLAVAPDMWDIHASISKKTDVGHGGIYYHIMGEADPKTFSRAIWLSRPRGIRFEEPLAKMINQATDSVSVWRKQMVLGPGAEFVVLGDTSLTLMLADGWTAHEVDRVRLDGEQ